MTTAPMPRANGKHPYTDLERIVLGDDRRYRRDEVSRLAGIEPSEARRLWRAMGFADVGDEARVFTEADLAALRLVATLRRRGSWTRKRRFTSSGRWDG